MEGEVRYVEAGQRGPRKREAPGGDPRQASATSHSIVRERAAAGREGVDGGEAGAGRRRQGRGGGG